MPQGRPPDHERDAATLLALGGVLMSAMFVLGLAAIVFPNLLAIIVLVVAVALFGVMHYVIWGRWLMKRLTAAEQAARHQITSNVDISKSAAAMEGSDFADGESGHS